MKQFSADDNILSKNKSGFRSGHSSNHNSSLVGTNNIVNALDRRQNCSALFVDLSKAFDSVAAWQTQQCRYW